MKFISDILPIYNVERNLIISKMGDITMGFELELPEIFTLSADELEAFHQAWLKAIKVMPAGTILLQRIESYLILDVISRRISKERPDLCI